MACAYEGVRLGIKMLEEAQKQTIAAEVQAKATVEGVRCKELDQEKMESRKKQPDAAPSKSLDQPTNGR